MTETDKRYIRPLGLGVFGKGFIDIFTSYKHLPDYVHPSCLHLDTETLQKLKTEIEKLEYSFSSEDDRFLFGMPLPENDNEPTTEIKKMIKNSLKIIFVVDVTLEHHCDTLFALIEFAKRYYVVFEVILVLPSYFKEDSESGDLYEIALIKLKRELVKTTTIRFDKHKDEEKIFDSVLFAIQNY